MTKYATVYFIRLKQDIGEDKGYDLQGHSFDSKDENLPLFTYFETKESAEECLKKCEELVEDKSKLYIDTATMMIDESEEDCSV